MIRYQSFTQLIKRMANVINGQVLFLMIAATARTDAGFVLYDKENNVSPAISVTFLL